MREQLTGTDIRYIAKGYWKHHFRWGFHPQAKASLLTALITFLAGLAVLGGYLVDQYSAPSAATNSTPQVATSAGPSAISFVAMALILIAAGFFLKGVWTIDREQDKFLDSVTAKWESGDKSLPDTNTVTQFLERR